jgi:hypothetical protein
MGSEEEHDKEKRGKENTKGKVYVGEMKEM